MPSGDHDFDIHFEGLDDIMEDFRKAELQVPNLSEQVLKKGMRRVKRLSIDHTPEREEGRKHINKCYKVLPVEYGSSGTNIKMTNTAPHFHLIEKGHRMVMPGTLVEYGFKPGVHMVQRAIGEAEPLFVKDVERMVKKILK